MSSRPLSPLTAFVLFAILCSGAFAQSESSPRPRAQDPLTLRNWAVDFSPLTDGPADRSGRVMANAAVPSAASHFITMVPCRVVDTRRPDGLHGGPKLVQAGTRSFDINDGHSRGIMDIALLVPQTDFGPFGIICSGASGKSWLDSRDEAEHLRKAGRQTFPLLTADQQKSIGGQAVRSRNGGHSTRFLPRGGFSEPL